MRISDVSSDVCSSDLTSNGTFQLHSIQVGALAFTPGNNKQDEVREGDRPYASLLYVANGRSYVRDAGRTVYHTSLSVGLLGTQQIGRASCWESVCQYVEILVVAGALTKKT